MVARSIMPDSLKANNMDVQNMWTSPMMPGQMCQEIAPLFKQTYNSRTEVERYFSRLGDREVEQTTHYIKKSIQNQMTFAHFSLSVIAFAAAVLMKQPHKIRCYRTFAYEQIPIKFAA